MKALMILLALTATAWAHKPSDAQLEVALASYSGTVTHCPPGARPDRSAAGPGARPPR